MRSKNSKTEVQKLNRSLPAHSFRKQNRKKNTREEKIEKLPREDDSPIRRRERSSMGELGLGISGFFLCFFKKIRERKGSVSKVSQRMDTTSV